MSRVAMLQSIILHVLDWEARWKEQLYCKQDPVSLPEKLSGPHLHGLLLILHGPHLILVLMHLSILPNLPISHFSHMFLHILRVIPHHKVGGLNSTNLLLYYLHLHLNHNSFILFHLRNLRCLLNQIWTQTTRRHNRSTVERHPTLHMIWRFKKLTRGLEEC